MSVSEIGFLNQCVKLNKSLREAHQVAAQIVGPLVQDQEVAEETDCLAGRLKNLIEVGLNDVQGLVEQLNRIARQFERDRTQGEPK